MTPNLIGVAVLDDYQGVARELRPTGRAARACADVTVFTEHLADEDALAERLAAVRRRRRDARAHPLPARAARAAARTCGCWSPPACANASIDIAAAAEHGVTVCGTGGRRAPTAELTWALILALTRHVPSEDAGVRAGGWQHDGRRRPRRRHARRRRPRPPRRAGGDGRAGVRHGRRSPGARTSTDERPPSRRRAGRARRSCFATSDVVTVHCMLSERTRGLIVGAAELAADEADRATWSTPRAARSSTRPRWSTRSGPGASPAPASTCYDTEPLPRRPPAAHRAAARVLTPHLGYVTAGTYQVFYGDAVEAIIAFLAGHPIRILTA